MSAEALVCCAVADGRELRDGTAVRTAGERVLLAASEAQRLVAAGAVVVLDDAEDSPDSCEGQPT
ncbi:MAG TPA: hypothetical protein VGL93_34100 [Streptosporangiaceae bacterium]